MSFEEKMKRLEDIAGLIREGEAGFDKQLELFKEGRALAAELEKELARAEQVIEEIDAAAQEPGTSNRTRSPGSIP